MDVPELGYTTKDKPHPRGELRLKTKLMIPGYFKHPKVSHLPPSPHLNYHLGAIACCCVLKWALLRACRYAL